MSEVSNLIVTFSNMEDEISRSRDINLFFNNGQSFNLVSVDFENKTTLFGKRKRWYGGSKKLETPLYIGAINHLNLEEFIKFMQQIEWDEPENVQIIIQEQESSKFRIIEL